MIVLLSCVNYRPFRHTTRNHSVVHVNTRPLAVPGTGSFSQYTLPCHLHHVDPTIRENLVQPEETEPLGGAPPTTKRRSTRKRRRSTHNEEEEEDTKREGDDQKTGGT